MIVEKNTIIHAIENTIDIALLKISEKDSLIVHIEFLKIN